ncbi:hypothetical protein FA048_12550 [Pedobacter polaris]|uniref:Tyr recombinase domain-containing protein n=1 Tax=Pedobacter polaris TaxID=2571273 RepID=A0A4U1CN37_9SPHI|nr:tyrosine-type recombinase/integrase [Pedobacter polaris]TKC07988.1 hypothetical protein FA048_12550 [Pedobacter polaris]
MASIKVLLSTNKTYSDGSHPIIFQIIDNRKVFKKVIYKCLPKYWDASQSKLKSSAPNSLNINKLITSKLSFYEKALLLAKEENRIIDKEIFNEKTSLSLVEVLEKEIVKMDGVKKFSTVIKYGILKDQVKRFKDIPVDNINKAWMENFALHLKLENGNIGSTINKKLVNLKGVIKKYSKNRIDQDANSFKVTVNEKIKQKLTRLELDKIINLKLPTGDILETVRDFFILQVYLRGVRVGDLLQATEDNFKDSRFIYSSLKTGTHYDMSLILPAIVIVEKYAVQQNLRLFPFWKWQPNEKKSDDDNEKARTKHKEACTSLINKYLKMLAEMADINKNLSTHIARHSFAVLADESTGGNIAIIQQLLGHSKRSTTEGYIKNLKMTDTLDQAADNIFKDIL